MKRALASACGAVLVLFSSSCVPKTGSPDGHAAGVPNGKLPGDVTPLHYRLRLDVDPRKNTFSGEVFIRARLNKPARRIWMHGNHLGVRLAEVTPAGGTPVKIDYEQVNEGGVVRARFDRILAPGEVTFHFVYEAEFDHRLRGLYLVEVGEDRYAFSQLESLDARRVFPGFDEPRFKTPFDVTVTTNEKDVVAANMSVAEEHLLAGGKRRTTFQTTPPIPTYLLAWAVGPLDIVTADPIPASDVRDYEVPLRALVPRGRGDQAKYALSIAPDLLQMIEDYTEIAYPYDKLDLVAVPDFAWGAMENPGLVTYRETRLLVDNESAAASDKQALLSTTAHEFAHMWFGDLVTTAWWDDIWLNEAFATWMAARVSHAYEPKSHFDLEFVAGAEGAMGQDSYQAARRIREPIKSDHDVRNAFDGITYSKGGAVLGMVESYVGPLEFRKGIQKYLNDHANQSVTLDAFITSLNASTGRDLSPTFDSFLNQSGVPYLDIRVSCEGAPESEATVHIEQSRYLPLGSQASPKRTWAVPVCVRYGAGGSVERHCDMATGAASDMTLPSCPDWVFPNADGSGYYRWRLDEESAADLREHGTQHLNERELMSLVDSVGAGMARGEVSFADGMDTLLPLAAHESRFIATAPMGALVFARDELVPEQREKIERLARNTYGPVWEMVQDPDADPQLRARVAGFLAFTARDPKVRATLAEQGRKYVGWKSDGAIHRHAVEPQLVGIALEVAAQESGAEFLDHLITLLKAEDDATIRWQLLSGIAAVTDPKLTPRVLALTSKSMLRGNEQAALVQMHRSQPENRESVWQWFKANFETIRATVPPAHAGNFPALARGFWTEAREKEVREFFEPFIEELPGGPRNLQKTLESMELKRARVNAQKESAKAYFEALEI